MKKLILAIALMAATTANAVTFSDDYKPSGLNEKQVELLVTVVKAYGYSCDVVNAAYGSALNHKEWNLVCDDWTYSYEIEDKGGRAVVRVD